MLQKEKDNKVLQVVKGKLVDWSCKWLSIVGRILVANQVILAFVWYIFSYANIFLSSLKKVKTLVHNCIWSNKSNNKTRVKVTWDTTILPLTKGGIKILDLEAHTCILFAKMLIQGFNLLPKPWKILLHHRVDNLKQNFKG
jgi:hypothetical protein